MRARWICAAIPAAAALTLLVPAAPGYDAWAWLLWGRELSGLSLDTVAGPAWKPLPAMTTAVLAAAGDAAPALWLLVARAGALAAVVLAFVVARRLSGSTAAGVVAAVAVALTGAFVRHAAVGDTEPLLVALLLGAFDRALAGRHRQALAVAALAALLRPEVWPFAGAFAVWLWREDRGLRPALLALGVAVPAAWFVPDLLASGELLRSGSRARVPNPGQPATADVPFLATLAAAASVVFAPAALGALAARGRAGVLAAGGTAWIVVVAAMSQAGFAGEPRYLVPGAALLAVAGAAGLVRAAALLGSGRRPLRATVLGVSAAAVVLAAGPRVDAIVALGPRLAHQARLSAELDRAIAAVGGREAILACGRPAVGRYRGTLLAWHLAVAKRTVRADGRPAAVTFRSRLTPSARPSPVVAGRITATTPLWQVAMRCDHAGVRQLSWFSRVG